MNSWLDPKMATAMLHRITATAGPLWWHMKAPMFAGQKLLRLAWRWKLLSILGMHLKTLRDQHVSLCSGMVCSDSGGQLGSSAAFAWTCLPAAPEEACLCSHCCVVANSQSSSLLALKLRQGSTDMHQCLAKRQTGIQVGLMSICMLITPPPSVLPTHFCTGAGAQMAFAVLQCKWPFSQCPSQDLPPMKPSCAPAGGQPGCLAAGGAEIPRELSLCRWPANACIKLLCPKVDCSAETVLLLQVASQAAQLQELLVEEKMLFIQFGGGLFGQVGPSVCMRFKSAVWGGTVVSFVILFAQWSAWAWAAGLVIWRGLFMHLPCL